MHTDVKNELAHYGVLGMKWGVRRSQSALDRAAGRVEKKDLKWVRTKGSRITAKTQKAVSKDMRLYERELASNTPMRNKSGQISRTFLNQYNKKLAAVMNSKVGNIPAPSGRVLRYVAKRGELGVHTALADQAYNMENVKNGVNAAGRIAYRKDTLKKA